MAETLISPGVLARENDQSLVTAQPLVRGAAIIGPTVKGPVEKPTYVSSFSSFQAIFGGALESGSTDYTYLTSVAANNYFSSGGSSLLVTRVTSGSFSPALSTNIENNVETGDGGLVGGLTPWVGGTSTGDEIDTYTEVVLGGVAGTGAKATVTTVASGLLVASTTSVPTGTGVAAGSYANSVTSDAIEITAGMVNTAGASGGTAVITTDATGAVVVGVDLAIIDSTGYAIDSIITIPGATLQADAQLGSGGSGGDIIIQLAGANVGSKIGTVSVTTEGSGYVAGNVLTIAAGALDAASTEATHTLLASEIENATTFVLETLSEGIIMNNTTPAGADSAGTELSGGALALGSADNIRWEIASVNTASGVFSLLVRRGNDNNNQRVVLESYNNISLDPFSPNYISRAIGDITSNVVVAADGSGTYLQESGSYPNISNYIRVKEVKFNTPHYFQNNGVAKNEFTSSLPVVGSGSFDQAVGSNLNSTSYNRFYEKIDGTNTQGLIGTDYTNAINLLANQDDYQYNVISAPGLYYSNYASQCNLIKNNTISRGDAIFIMDLVPYNTAINTVLQNASGIDSSYSAAYWPWLQTVDPNTGLLIYIPASTMIPGVYAFTDASSDPWFAPAGITRGGMGSVVRAERKLTSANRDTLYEGNVNPIATFPQQGVVVFGQKTLQKAATALDRVNVRRLLITLKDYISQIADNLVFEANTIATRNNFLTQVNPYLESVQQRQGLYAFKVVMDETNNTPDVIDRNELIGQIFLQPTKTAEFIILDFNVLPTGATFPA
ncbi:phage tail sheath subtilisin-like domain-containing protein [bacterium]|nr:phage tail sheath subtilisin-like domain-containing protein [bacterium]